MIIFENIYSISQLATYRNQSLDDLIEETMTLTNELNAIGKNINQIAKKFNTLELIPEFKEQLLHFEFEKRILFNKIDEVKNHTQKVAERWL